jgi:hypothetical protein
MRLLLEYIQNDDYAGLPRVLDSASGKDNGVERLRVVDVDDKGKLQETIDHIKTLRPYRDPEYILETMK